MASSDATLRDGYGRGAGALHRLAGNIPGIVFLVLMQVSARARERGEPFRTNHNEICNAYLNKGISKH